MRKTLISSSYGFVCVFVLLCLPRFLALDADPPSFFAPGFIADEGWWVHNPRQAVLFGEWTMDDFNQSLIISPVYSFFAWLSFSGLGVSFISARLPSALAGSLTLLLLVLWSRRLVREKNASAAMPWIVAVLYGIDIFAIGFARVALVDTMMVMFLLAAVFFWDRGTVSSAVLSGSMLCLATCVKPTAVFMAAVLLLTWLWERYVNREDLARPIALAITTLFGAAVWFVLMYPVGLEQFIDLNRRFSQDNLPGSLIDGVRNCMTLVLTRQTGQFELTRFAAQSPILLIFFACMFIGLLTAIRRQGALQVMKNMQRWQILLVLWTIIGTVLLMPNQYKPERRFLFLIAPLAMITAYVLADWLNTPSQQRSADNDGFVTAPLSGKATGGLTIFLLAAGTFLPAIMIAVSLLRKIETFVLRLTPDGGGTVLLLVTGMVVWAFLVGAVRIIISRTPGPSLKKKVASLSLIATVLFHGTMIVTTAQRMSFTIRDISRLIGRDFEEGQAVMGGIADSLCIENKAFSFAVFQAGDDIVYNGSPMERFAPVAVLHLRELDGSQIPDKELETYRTHLVDRTTLELMPRADRTYRVRVDWYRVARPERVAD